MAGKSDSLDYWRKFFRSANSDIFEVVEQAIVVAAVDCPKEFRSRRDRIAEKLFTCKLSRCVGCNNVELQIPDDGEDLGEEEGGGSVKREVGEKGSKMDSCNGEPEDLNRGGLSNYSYDEAEALTDVMEEESQIVGEVLRIKEVLYNKLDQSDAVLYESLRRLELMQLSVETLKATEIGRAVNGLRKHNSKQIRNLVRTLIVGWKELVDEWVNATAAIADHSPDSVNPSMAYEEEGLPSPPLDEGALLATQTTSIQLSEFFDGMDDDGNFRTPGDFDNIRDTERTVPRNRGPPRRQEPPRQRQPEVPMEKTQVSKQEIVVRQAKPQAIPSAQSKPQGIVNKPSKPSAADSGPGRPLKPSPVQKPNTQFSNVQRKLSNGPMEKSKNSEEASVDAKLEQAKRKLHERYQQVENAKRQRTIQVMDINDLPKQSNMKPKNQLRNWANARR
ncbi:hypothetical protein M5K25_000815 [Dendrobium thyrsiflorum]|uniref:TFIIS N-terminal domain-containing protein n=1 Tax=Dendrobium thyrsiflorum TaxID=117978 RepID=A0ABD0VUZ0_DENTH